jgi:SAM-dependent methyltransferase
LNSDDAGADPSTVDLDEIARTYDPSDASSSFDYYLKQLQVDAILPWLYGDHVLELGCATGELTSGLATHSRAYDIVEAASANVEIVARRVPAARVFLSRWENFEPDADYSDILLVNALEHAVDPVELLLRARRWLRTGGRMHLIVPNGLSIHRLVGVELGLLTDPVRVADADLAQGHLRNYTTVSLAEDVAAADLAVRHSQGIFLKIVSNSQMLGWSQELIGALDRVARQFEDNAATLYMVTEPSGA